MPLNEAIDIGMSRVVALASMTDHDYRDFRNCSILQRFQPLSKLAGCTVIQILYMLLQAMVAVNQVYAVAVLGTVTHPPE